jgi:two-component system, chemotaxis family, response regulator Rcp1
MMKNPDEVIKILLVEDSLADIRLTQEVFKEGKIQNELHSVKDGEEAMEFLRRRGRYADAPRPDLVLLDLNLPKKDGKEVLKEIKSDQELASIPVIVLTTSKAEEDIHRTYDLHANCFITKPFDLDKFIAVAKSIEDFWFRIVKLPHTGGK